MHYTVSSTHHVTHHVTDYRVYLNTPRDSQIPGSVTGTTLSGPALNTDVQIILSCKLGPLSRSNCSLFLGLLRCRDMDIGLYFKGKFLDKGASILYFGRYKKTCIPVSAWYKETFCD